MSEQPPPEPVPAAWLTPAQLRIVRAAVVALAGSVLVVVAVAGLWVFAQLMSTFRSLLLPVATAGVIALVLYPLTQWLVARARLPRVAAVGAVVVLLMGAAALGLVLVLPMLVEQLIGLYREAAAYAVPLLERIAARFPVAEDVVQSSLDDAEFETLVPPLEGVFERIGSFVSLLVGMGFVPVFLFFFLLSGGELRTRLAELTSVFSADVQQEVQYLVEVFVNYVGAFFQGQLIIALIMAVLYSVGFAAIGLEAALALGLFSGLLNIVPFLGTAVGLLLVLPYAWLAEDGGTTLMLLALAVFVTVQLVESWFLTPRIMSDRSGLHPAMVIVSLFFWGTLLGGIIGVLLAVPLSAFVATLWHQLRYRYARHVVAGHDGHEPGADEPVPPPGQPPPTVAATD